MSDVRYITISAEDQGQRLDNYLIKILKGVPKSHVYRVIRAGQVRVNKKRSSVSLRLETGDLVRIPPVRVSPTKEVFVGDTLQKQLLESIVYEDNDLLVLNKPVGLAVHGGSGLSLGVIEGLRKIRTDLPYLELVHRLDKETSGCLLIAKKRSALRAIHALLEAREVQKTYWALLTNAWQGQERVRVNESLKKNQIKSGERIVMVSPDGKSSETTFTLLENFEQACLVEASPKTGRTHQIRVHSAYLGHSIVGDKKYGENLLIDGLDFEKGRLYLHARAIQFTLNGKHHVFKATLDGQFSLALKTLRARGLSTHE